MIGKSGGIEVTPRRWRLMYPLLAAFVTQLLVAPAGPGDTRLASTGITPPSTPAGTCTVDGLLMANVCPTISMVGTPAPALLNASESFTVTANLPASVPLPNNASTTGEGGMPARSVTFSCNPGCAGHQVQWMYPANAIVIDFNNTTPLSPSSPASSFPSTAGCLPWDGHSATTAGCVTTSMATALPGTCPSNCTWRIGHKFPQIGTFYPLLTVNATATMPYLAGSLGSTTPIHYQTLQDRTGTYSALSGSTTWYPDTASTYSVGFTNHYVQDNVSSYQYAGSAHGATTDYPNGSREHIQSVCRGCGGTLDTGHCNSGDHEGCTYVPADPGSCDNSGGGWPVSEGSEGEPYGDYTWAGGNRGCFYPQNKTISTQVWVTGGHYETRQRWVSSGHYETRYRWVSSGHYETRQRWVSSGHEVSGWYWDWNGRRWYKHYYSYWEDTSHWESYQVWVDTSHYESYQVWVDTSHWESYQVWVDDGHWETRTTTVTHTDTDDQRGGSAAYYYNNEWAYNNTLNPGYWVDLYSSAAAPDYYPPQTGYYDNQTVGSESQSYTALSVCSGCGGAAVSYSTTPQSYSYQQPVDATYTLGPNEVSGNGALACPRPDDLSAPADLNPDGTLDTTCTPTFTSGAVTIVSTTPGSYTTYNLPSYSVTSADPVSTSYSYQYLTAQTGTYTSRRLVNGVSTRGGYNNVWSDYEYYNSCDHTSAPGDGDGGDGDGPGTLNYTSGCDMRAFTVYSNPWSYNSYGVAASTGTYTSYTINNASTSITTARDDTVSYSQPQAQTNYCSACGPLRRVTETAPQTIASSIAGQQLTITVNQLQGTLNS